MSHLMTTICLHPEDAAVVQVLDQRRLPFEEQMVSLHTVQDAAFAIREMLVRGAPLIGVTAAYGMYLATLQEPAANVEAYYRQQQAILAATRPTAVDLFLSLHQAVQTILRAATHQDRIAAALGFAHHTARESISACRRIGEYGLPLIEAISRQKNGAPVNILTHCNAGFLACIEYGTATAPVYLAHEQGIPVHVWVDETRPRNQGARLTACELGRSGVPHTIISDNAGGHLMQHGMVDMVITGTDRTTRCGDVANKIGTYLKALAAYDNNIPFYVAAPSSSIDWNIRDGLADIKIEERNPDEIRYVEGWANGRIAEVLLCPEDSPAANYAFDVTPARLVTGIITERGVCAASEKGLAGLFPDRC